MSSAIIRNGHWRRRDELEGVSPAAREALVLADAAPLILYRGLYCTDVGQPGVSPATVTACCWRGLMRRTFGPDGRHARVILTRPDASLSPSCASAPPCALG